MTSPNFGSMMAWMVWLYTGYTIIMLVELWLAMRADLSRGRASLGLRGLMGRTLSLSRGPLTPKQDGMVQALAQSPRHRGCTGRRISRRRRRALQHARRDPEAYAPMPILFFLPARSSQAAGWMAFVVAAFWPERNEEHRQMVTFIGVPCSGCSS